MDVKLVLKYFWPHIKRYKKSTILVFVLFGLAVVGTDIASPILYKRIMDIVTSGQPPEALGSLLIGTVFMLGGVILIYNTFFRIGDYMMAFSQSQILKDITDDAFKRVGMHSYEFFSNTFTGSLIAKVKRYTHAFEEIHDQIIFTFWMRGLGLLFAFAVLAYFSPILGIILLVWLILYVGVTAFFVKKKFQKDLLTAEANSEVTGTLSDVITNALNVKMFASGDKEYDNFTEVTGKEEKMRRSAWYFQNLQFVFQGYFIAVFEFVGMFTAVYLWIQGSISAGTIILMQIYIFTAFSIVWSLGRNFTRMMRALAEAKEMVDIFEKPRGVKDPKDPEKCLIKDGRIEIKNINFSYGKETKEESGEMKDEKESVFENFSLDISSGEKVGLVGPSGAGKTTITKLLLRFVDVGKGEILIDGQNIADISQDDLRRKIAYVPQDPMLFHRTLRENISYAKPDASEEEIIEAAKKSHAYEFISKLPLGLDTYVGERGIKLSGGERQRVAIARAMLKDAPIIILDEATSSLDSISERFIQEAFGELMKGRTTIVIAHRLSTIQKMDKIVVFEKGKIIEEGTHKELLEKKGLYYGLWKQQSHGFVGE